MHILGIYYFWQPRAASLLEPTERSSGGPPSYETACSKMARSGSWRWAEWRAASDLLWMPPIPCPLPPTLPVTSNDGRRSDETTVKSVDAFAGAGVDGWRPVSDDIRLPLIPTLVPRTVETPLSNRVCKRTVILTTATSEEAGGGSTVQTQTVTDFDGVITSDCLRHEQSSALLLNV